MNEADLKAIQEGLRLAANRRTEYNFSGAGRGERHPDPIQKPISSYIPSVELPVKSKPVLGPKTSKLWTLLGIAATHAKHAGAWQVWTLAKALDPAGSGLVLRSLLLETISSLRVNIRNRQRWVRDAVEIGLLRERIKDGSKFYSLASVPNAAVILGCKHIGSKPASILTSNLFKKGWRNYLWAAQSTAYEDKLISQATKCELTGVSERTQRYYQSKVPGDFRRNFAHTRIDTKDIERAKETTGRHFFKFRDKTYQRLPDVRIVPREVARSLPKGRSHKNQKAINKLLCIGKQDQYSCVRIFCETDKQVKASQKRIDKLGANGKGIPDDLFKLYAVGGKKSNVWAWQPPF